MRRIVLLMAAVILIISMAFGASAATGATQVTSQATVFTDESCDITLTATFRLEQAEEKLTFPLPLEASNVTLNGSRVGTSITDEARHVDLSKITGGMAGEFSAVITYRLKDVVTANEEGFLEVDIPLLAGFAYPVENLSITVTMPGTVTAKPAFSSGYHQSNIEQDLEFAVEDATITVTSLAALKDHETLDMTLSVSEEMFPQTVIELQDMDAFYILMGVFAALALIYWLIFLRSIPPRFMTATTPPEGYSAGQMSSVLNLRGADMTMMVFTWAQLGYILIETDRKGRVLLHKQMEMGNERSGFEQRCFKNLFAARSMIDTSGVRYADLCQKTTKMPPSIHGLVHPRSGSSHLFRALMATVGLFSGICLGLALGAEAAVRWIPAMLVAIYCGIGSWVIQRWADDLFSRRKSGLIAALAVLVLWVVMSLMAGTFALDGWVMFAQLLAGLMVSFGGRRTEAGRQAMSEVLGLRWYLCRLSKSQLQYICGQNPDYFHTMVPYAMALGVDKAFAKRFGKEPQPDCPYLTGAANGRLSAEQWVRVMRRMVRTMDERSRQKTAENILALFRGFGK